MPDDINQSQQHLRKTQELTQSVRLPSDLEAVMILVDVIRHPNSELNRISLRLKQAGFQIEEESIRQLLEHYDLLKKTADTPVSTV